MQNLDKPQDIKVRTFEFATNIVLLCRSLDDSPNAARVLGKQLLRSGTSIGANVEEAYGSQSKADFVSKMSISTKEARETHYWLRLLVASNIVPAARLNPLIDESNQLVSILTTIVKKTRESMK